MTHEGTPTDLPPANPGMSESNLPPPIPAPADVPAPEPPPTEPISHMVSPEPEPVPLAPEPEAKTEEVAPAEGVQAEAGPEAAGEADHDETPTEPAPPVEPPSNKHWYVVKVQSGREESIKEAIERRVKIEGLEEFFGQIVIPVERVMEVRGGKRVQKERKLYPGYLMVEVEYNDRILYLFRETSGVGDFVGGTINRPPPPMGEREVQRITQQTHKPGQEPVVTAKPRFDKGDRVKVKDGTFAGMEGEVMELIEAKNQVRVQLTIFGRPVPVELEYWQVELE